MHMALFSVRYGFIPARVSISSYEPLGQYMELKTLGRVDCLELKTLGRVDYLELKTLGRVDCLELKTLGRVFQIVNSSKCF